MGTVCAIELPASQLADTRARTALDEIDRIERVLSTWKPESELSRLNTATPGTPRDVTPELHSVLSTAVEIAQRTGGAFNPLVGPLVDVWKTRAEGAIPDSESVGRALGRASLANVTFGAGTITLAAGAEFEEGGFGKGYALDHALDTLRASGETRALVNFGGQIAGYGYGDRLEVDIALPDHRETSALRLTIGDASVSTSSGSEKTFAAAGRTFSHIIDPRTGEALPPRGSATVIAERAFDADALSTALYVLGPEDGIAWADANDVAVIFLVPAIQPHIYQVVTSRAARARIHHERILDPRVHDNNSKGK